MSLVIISFISVTKIATDKKISELTSKTTPVDADSFAIYDSENVETKRITGTNLKAYLKTYFDSLYGGTPVAGEALGGSGVNRTLAHDPLSGTLIIFDGTVALHPTTDYTRVTTAVTFIVEPDNPVAYYRY